MTLPSMIDLAWLENEPAPSKGSRGWQGAERQAMDETLNGEEAKQEDRLRRAKG